MSFVLNEINKSVLFDGEGLESLFIFCIARFALIFICVRVEL